MWPVSVLPSLLSWGIRRLMFTGLETSWQPTGNSPVTGRGLGGNPSSFLGPPHSSFSDARHTGRPSWVTTIFGTGLPTALRGRCQEQAPAQGAAGKLGAWPSTHSRRLECCFPLILALDLFYAPPAAHPIFTMTAKVSINENSLRAISSGNPHKHSPPRPPQVGYVKISVLHRGWLRPHWSVEAAGFEPRQSGFGAALSVMWPAPTYWPAIPSKALQAGGVLREPLISPEATNPLAGQEKAPQLSLLTAQYFLAPKPQMLETIILPS